MKKKNNMTREEAIERIKARSDKWALDDEDMKAIQTLIPELAKSEDERIRKFLVKHVSEWIGCIEHDLKISSKDMESDEELAMFKAGLAYLEKQKEQSLRDYIDDFPYSEQKEQKPIRTDFRNEVKILMNLYKIKKEFTEKDYDFQAKELLELVEQKPAEWSKEDLLHLTNAILSAEKEWGNESCTAKWLKSLPERFNLQSKEDWSEEDKKMLVQVFESIRYADDHYEFDGKEVSSTDVKAWLLKSLRPQPNREWSAYDKATIEYIIEDIKGLRDEETDEEVIETYDRELNLLQCINASVKLCNYTNPAEWSGEDERMLNVAIRSCEQTIEDYPNDKVRFNDCIAWLKSLRPKPHTVPIKDATKFGNLEYERGIKDGIQSEKSCHWKPSEEQMCVFDGFYHNYILDQKDYEVLKSLYDDLKKLM